MFWDVFMTDYEIKKLKDEKQSPEIAIIDSVAKDNLIDFLESGAELTLDSIRRSPKTGQCAKL